MQPLGETWQLRPSELLEEVRVTYKAFALHAAGSKETKDRAEDPGCRPCEDVERAIRRESNPAAFHAWHDASCAAGKKLLEAWKVAVEAAVGAYREMR